ncbi:MAG: outer membrane protein transport protein [Gemmatimonadota bacterium]
MKRHHLLFLAVCSSLALMPSAARAQAFGLNELGSCSFARGFSTTSAPCNDASVVFWNPGAAAGMKGNSLLVGAAAIAIKAKFTRDSARGQHEGDVPLAIVPHIFYNRSMGDRMAVGFGLYVPYGLTSQWKDDFPGRFLAKKAALSSIYIQPNFAMSFKGGKWMLGGGPVFGHSTVELIQGADLSDQIASVITTATTRTVLRFSQLGIAKRTEFARATLTGSANSFGLNVGGMGKLTDKWTMGFRYLSSLMMNFDDAEAKFEQKATGITFATGNPLGYPGGTLFDTLTSIRSRFCTTNSGTMPVAPGAVPGSAQTCAAKGLLGNQSVKTRIPHPDQFQVGFAYTGFEGWLIAVDYELTGWRKLRELHVNFSNDSINTAATTNPNTSGLCPATVTVGEVCDYDMLDREILQDYNNTSSIRVGAEKTMKNGWLVRFGFAGVASAAPDETVTPLLPEQDRSYWSVGSAFPLIKDKVTLDATYGLVLGSGRRGRIDDRFNRSVSGLSMNSGIYDLSAHVLSFSLKANF